MKNKFITFISIILLVFGLCGCGTMDKINNIVNVENSSLCETLMSNIPMMNKETYNRFILKGQATAANANEESRQVFFNGVLETYNNISHIFKFTVTFPESNVIQAESWSDFSSGKRYVNIKEAGFTSENIADNETLNKLVSIINNRPENPDIVINDDVCTISWNFETNTDKLFSDLVSHVSNNTQISGNGRLMAVFDPVSHDFRYFNIVISANNEERVGALLDMTLQWNTINSETEALIIPLDVSNSAYLASTGITTNGGYNNKINPMAEDFIELYGGKADVSHYEGGSCMFWTLENDNISASVNYENGTKALSRYEDNYKFLKNKYGSPNEETENGAYFYDENIGELTYMAINEDSYVEIIITGKNKSQGELRKPLITYKSRIDI